VSQIEAQLKSVRSKMDSVSSQKVILIAVSKKHSVEAIREAYSYGQRDFGENYVDELVEKRAALSDLENIKFHFIGGVQSNKISTLNEVADVVHGACSTKHLKRLKVPCFAQVNIGDEPQKKGFNFKELVGTLDVDAFPLLQGLMCIPPVDSDPRPFFKKMAQVAEIISRSSSSKKHSPLSLSMGMSSDYECAVACGASHIRVGRAIFGERK